MRPTPPQVVKIIKILSKLPLGQIITTAELAGKLGIAELRGTTAKHEALSNHRERVNAKMYWGSIDSIIELRKRMNGNG